MDDKAAGKALTDKVAKRLVKVGRRDIVLKAK
jgi:hypothetical protein